MTRKRNQYALFADGADLPLFTGALVDVPDQPQVEPPQSAPADPPKDTWPWIGPLPGVNGDDPA